MQRPKRAKHPAGHASRWCYPRPASEGAMLPFGETMTPEQIDDVARYVYEATRRD
jgi:mono/diheme cytochrome c family protein